MREYCCAGKDAVKRKIREIENNKDATAVEQNLLTTLEVCYEFYLRGFHFDTINIYESDATKFKVTENGLLPPFTTVHGLGEAAAIDTVEKRNGKEFVSVEEFAMCCNKLSKTHIEQLKALGAFAGMGGDQPADAVLIPVGAISPRHRDSRRKGRTHSGSSLVLSMWKELLLLQLGIAFCQKFFVLDDGPGVGAAADGAALIPGFHSEVHPFCRFPETAVDLCLRPQPSCPGWGWERRGR